MSKHGLNIYKRKDGRWEGRYKDGFKSDGSVKYRSIYGKSYSMVKERLQKLKVNDGKSSCNMTVEILFNEWLSAISLKVKTSTLATYRLKVIKHIIPVFGKLRFNAISPKLINDFIEKKLKYGLSKRYVSDIIMVFKSMAKYISKVYNCINPIEYVSVPKVEKEPLRLLNQIEQSKLKKELLKDMNLTKLSILICMFTGIRIGELCALKWSNINFNNNTISINQTLQRVQNANGDTATKILIGTPKSKTSIRVIPIPKFLITLLYQFKSNKDYFILSNSIIPIEPRTIQYRFKSILKKANLPSINFHSLRHMFATNCIILGFDIKTLSEILGHSTVEITLNKYVHSSMDRKIDCMNKLTLFD